MHGGSFNQEKLRPIYKDSSNEDYIEILDFISWKVKAMTASIIHRYPFQMR